MDPARGPRRAAIPGATPSPGTSNNRTPGRRTPGTSSAHPLGTQRTALTIPLGSDDSASEPELSILGMSRAGDGDGLDDTAAAAAEAYAEAMEEEVLDAEQYEAEDTSIDEQVEEQDELVSLVDPLSIGLKEISNLGKFTVSSHKPGSGVEELRSEDLKLYWQLGQPGPPSPFLFLPSDGPQPHKLTVYFVKRVGIREIRFYVDYHQDESYTPTKMVFKSGTSENNLIEFATMTLDSPVGWQQVPLTGTGGEPDGNTLVSYVLQMQVLENHQNGKDTHLRAIKIYAFDADATDRGADAAATAAAVVVADEADQEDGLAAMVRALAAARIEAGDLGYTIPDFMREPEIR
ncbi:hypothetical protein XA68_10669 [Ophiocordyceps unilateralis]|uniref:DOC domain-containing protein n=1 Tax=Ophiocordyceps unilateralis TaxID=268505 RepID=A0A2A9P2C3_OPHUN|nr:hypothetical protein XA68_10669 [Ophiocordyceps unilateralis]